MSLSKTGAGTLTRIGRTCTLDLGTLVLGAGPETTDLAVLNSALGPADLLSGQFDLAGLGSGFVLSRFGSFAASTAGSTTRRW